MAFNVFPNPHKAATEIHRVLKKDGSVFGTVFIQPPPEEILSERPHRSRASCGRSCRSSIPRSGSFRSKPREESSSFTSEKASRADTRASPLRRALHRVTVTLLRPRGASGSIPLARAR